MSLWNQMKISYFSGPKSWLRSGFSRVFSVSFYSTETQTSSPSKDSLFRRISPVGDPRDSIVPVLDKWVEDGGKIKREELQTIVKQLRLYKRYKHALEVSQWMSDKRYFYLSPGDIAIRLDLISKSHGLEEAEKYFNSIPNQSRAFQVYGSLLNCYASAKSVDKAESLMQKMKELGFAKSTLAYNALLNLYCHTGQHEKLDVVMQEMEEKGIRRDNFSFSIRLTAYAATSDIKGIEKTLKIMEADSRVDVDWNAYAVAANGYIKSGLIDKAVEMLKKSEELVSGKKSRVALEYLLSLYASAGKRDELYRIWNQYKTKEKVYNSAYMCMISSLVKLDDIEGAERILEEWENGETSYDFRVPNILISAYCKRGLLGKAETFISKAIERGKKPLARTWEFLATGYIEDNQMEKAVETMKKAIMVSRPGSRPNRDNLAACVEHLKGKGDMVDADVFIRLLGDQKEEGGSENDDEMMERVLESKQDKGT